jgi:hypothetical protein
MNYLSRASRFWSLALVSLALSVAGSTSSGQTQKAAAEPDPLFKEYRGVQIGWLADDVRKKLGSPANKADDQDFYTFGEKETVQFLYDKSNKVTTISVDFSNGASGVLTPQQVFGSEIEAKADGSKYKLVRYPKVGYWISYNRTAGDSPLVSVTIQKIAQP